VGTRGSPGEGLVMGGQSVCCAGVEMATVNLHGFQCRYYNSNKRVAVVRGQEGKKKYSLLPINGLLFSHTSSASDSNGRATGVR
jgi:hypothetical protein